MAKTEIQEMNLEELDEFEMLLKHSRYSLLLLVAMSVAVTWMGWNSVWWIFGVISSMLWFLVWVVSEGFHSTIAERRSELLLIYQETVLY